MSIVAGSDGLASDFVSTSGGAGDSGKVPKLNGSGQLDDSFIQHPNRKQEIVITFILDAAGIDTTSGSFVGAADTLYMWTAANWDSGITWYFEVIGEDGGATPSRCNVQLYNDTDAAEIDNVTAGEATSSYVRSGALTMPSSGTKKLIINFRNSVSGSTVTLKLARLVGVAPA